MSTLESVPKSDVSREVSRIEFSERVAETCAFRGISGPSRRSVAIALIATLIATLIASQSIFVEADSAPERPNIVFVLADDLGWTDLGCFGSSYYRTPRIDSLRSRGMKFTAAYSSGPNCAPTRAALLSGQYGPRHGIHTVGSAARGDAAHRELVPVPNETELDLGVETIAERLSAAGYRCAHVGKWHLGAAPRTGPEQQGFEMNAGGDARGHPPSYFSPYRIPTLADGPNSEYLTDRLTAEALAFIDAAKERPFFLYLAHYAVHTPLEAKSDLVERAREVAPEDGHRDPVYAAMIRSLDESVGRIIDRLESSGLARDTVVIFSSDNGGVGGYARAGIRGSRDITDNAPLRGGKGMLYEGGVRVPTIVVWPGVTAPGSTCDTPVASVDWYPTLLEIAGATAPSQPLDGLSLAPMLRSARAESIAERALYWHFPAYLEAGRRLGAWRTTPAGAIRLGDFKLIEFFESGRLELYDLARDPGESTDLAREDPLRALELQVRLRRWRREIGAAMPLRATDRDATALARAHAHNDYDHERPLVDALSHGFASVEADVFAIDGELFVAHDRPDVRPERTLRRLYLDPLRERARARGGRVHPDAEGFLLHVDFKSDGDETYRLLREQLADYDDILTRIDGERVIPGAVTVIISGNRPWERVAADRVRRAGIDGRLSDLSSDKPPSLMPLVSDNWRNHFSWRGLGPMPPGEREKLRGIVEAAHAKGWKLRFWATPENEAVWEELDSAGVDLLNTDELARLRTFLIAPERRRDD